MSFISPNIDFKKALHQSDVVEQRYRVKEHYEQPGWKSGFFYTHGMTIPFSYVRAPKERALAVGLAGLNARDTLDPSEVNQLIDAGISFIWAELPPPKRGVPINLPSIQAAYYFLALPDSPVQTLFRQGLPSVLFLHSTSGRIAQDLLHQREINRQLSSKYCGFVYINSFYDTANSSALFDPIKHAVFSYYARNHANLMPHETIMGRAYMKAVAPTEKFTKRESKGNASAMPIMTFGHIDELITAGLSRIRHYDAAATNKIPSLSVISQTDPFSCPRTSVMVVEEKMRRTPLVLTSGKHYPFPDNPELMGKIIDVVEGWMHDFQQYRRYYAVAAADFFTATTQAPSEENAPSKSILFSGSRLGNRAVAFPQCSAGALDPSACFA